MRTPLSLLALALWLPFSGCHRTSPAAVEPARPTLTFYLVAPEKIPGGRFIDTPDLPKLGYVASTPDLVVSSLQSATSSAMPPGGMRWDKDKNISSGGEKSRPAMMIQLREKDAKELGLLAGHGAGRKMLMMLGDTPLMAQELKGSIPGGRILLTFDEKGDHLRIQDDLEQMTK